MNKTPRIPTLQPAVGMLKPRVTASLGIDQGTGRPIAASWYSSRSWRAKRLKQLEAHPLCVMCAERGIVRTANVADHIEPHRGSEEAFWNGELQSVCTHCHSSHKQRQERGNGT